MKILVLCGGASPERDVSLATGAAVADALEALGHDVMVADPALGLDQMNAGFALAKAAPGKAPPDLTELQKTAGVNSIAMLGLPGIQGAEVVFLALHGTGGEDGSIQALLDAAGVNYTGSGMRASAVAMDKNVSKHLFAAAGIPTPEWIYVAKGREGKAAGKVRLPVVVKPNDQGSTVGLSIVKSEDELGDALSLAGAYSEGIIIEKYIEGRELTVGILGGEAMPIVEIKPTHDMYDYECKYTSGMTEYVCPAELPEDVTAAVQASAVEAFNALGCRDYARADFRLDMEGKHHILEVNTLPGMTATSLVPKAAKAAGMSFEELIGRIVEIVKERG